MALWDRAPDDPASKVAVATTETFLAMGLKEHVRDAAQVVDRVDVATIEAWKL